MTGVYLNEMQASKMDWYIQRKSTVKRTGDNTYHVTYSFTNTLQPGEAGSLPEYITANAKGGVAVNRVVIYTRPEARSATCRRRTAVPSHRCRPRTI